MQPSDDFNEHLQASRKRRDEERAERAFSDYYGVNKSLAWRSHYGERPYLEYWSASKQDRNAMKEELGIAAEQRAAYAEAKKMYGSIRNFALESGMSIEEARELVGYTLINVFREEYVKSKDLREDLYWNEWRGRNAEVPRLATEFDKNNSFTVDLMEESRIEMEERLKDFGLTNTPGIAASDLSPEALRSKFSTWKYWIYEICEKSFDPKERWAAERLYSVEQDHVDNRDQGDSNDLSQSYDPEIDIVLGDDSASQMESGSIGVTKVDNDIERIIFGDEKSDSMLLDKGIQSSGVREDSLQGKEERENDERSR